MERIGQHGIMATIPSLTNDSALIAWSSEHNGTPWANAQAKIELKRKMIQLKFFQSGVGEDRQIVKRRWDQWLGEFGLGEDSPALTGKNELRAWIKQFVNEVSDEWKKKGIWKLRQKRTATWAEGGSPQKRSRVGALETVVLHSQALEVAEKPDWDGSFADLADIRQISPEDFVKGLRSSYLNGSLNVRQFQGLLERLPVGGALSTT